MGLDIIMEACETKIFYENEGYFNLETADEIPFNERCQMRTIESVKNDYELLDELSFVVSCADKEIDNCKYTILEQEELEQLTHKKLSEEGLKAIKKVLAEVDFEKETVTVYPWW